MRQTTAPTSRPEGPQEPSPGVASLGWVDCITSWHSEGARESCHPPCVQNLVVAAGFAPALAALSTPCLCCWATRPKRNLPPARVARPDSWRGPANSTTACPVCRTFPTAPGHAGQSVRCRSTWIDALRGPSRNPVAASLCWAMKKGVAEEAGAAPAVPLARNTCLANRRDELASRLSSMRTHMTGTSACGGTCTHTGRGLGSRPLLLGCVGAASCRNSEQFVASRSGSKESSCSLVGVQAINNQL